MAHHDALNPHPREFERFLYASVGVDRNGHVVTVLSTLARLGIDPWNETAELVALTKEAAQLRLEKVLLRFRDVPALVTDHRTVARKLSLLLPEGPPRSPTQADFIVALARLASSGAVWALLALALILMQVLFDATPGEGE
nr:hypothetical protein [Nitrosomonas nitrosa]